MIEKFREFSLACQSRAAVLRERDAQAAEAGEGLSQL